MSYTPGKVLGGTHSPGIGMYTRGNRRIYDNWANVYGARGWSGREVMPYFLRSENNTDPAILAQNPAVHSTSGTLEVTLNGKHHNLNLKLIHFCL